LKRGSKENASINDPFDPWDALEILENRAQHPDFFGRWRAFARACSHAVPKLPAKARGWIAVADRYEDGRITEDQLTKVRDKAWTYLKASRAAFARSDRLPGLSMAWLRLWPDHDADHWYETAHYFLTDCEAAGLSVTIWWPLLQSSFSDFLGEVQV
jgi:hypothetical protein